jgi:hypothetical protein
MLLVEYVKLIDQFSLQDVSRFAVKLPGIDGRHEILLAPFRGAMKPARRIAHCRMLNRHDQNDAPPPELQNRQRTLRQLEQVL